MRITCAMRLVLPVTAAAIALVACGSRTEESRSKPEGDVLYFATWEGEIAPDTLPEFRRRTGIRVEVEHISDSAHLQTKLMTGHSGTDIAVPPSNILQPLIAAGALLKLDRSKLPNWRHLDPELMKRLERIDPGNQYAVPFLWGWHAFAYNDEAVRKALGREPEPSWNLIFDPEQARRLSDCGIAWQDTAGVFMNDLALIALGRDPGAESAEDLEAAEAAFMRVRPYVRYIESTLRPRSELASGEICITIGNNGDMLQAREIALETGSGVDVRFITPREGALMWVDLLTIPADAPHPDAAHRFIDYLMEPAVIAEITEASRFANGNAAADALIDPAIRANPGIYPPEDVRLRLHLVPAESLEYSRLRTRMWTRVRTTK